MPTVNGTIQKDTVTDDVRGNFGSSGLVEIAKASDIPTVTPVSFTAFGSTPNANGASVTSNVITLQPADATNSGGISNSAYQVLPGFKDFAKSFRVTGTDVLASGQGVQIRYDGSSGYISSYNATSSSDRPLKIEGSIINFGNSLGINATINGNTGAINSSALTNGLVGSTSGTLGNITALPSGTTATTQTAADNSTKVATTAYADAAAAGSNLFTRASSVISPFTSTDVLSFAGTGITNTLITAVASGASGIAIQGQASGVGGVGLRGLGGSNGNGAQLSSGASGFAGARVGNTSSGLIEEWYNSGGVVGTVANNGTIQTTPQGTLYGTASGSITSAQLLASLTDETGTGVAVFSASPTLTGVPLSTTAALGTNTTQIATTQFTQQEKTVIPLQTFIATVNNSGTGETDIFSYTTAANRLNANGESVSATYAGMFNSATATEVLKVYFAGTQIAASTGAVFAAGSSWRIETTVLRTSSTTVRCVTVITGGVTVITSQVDLSGLTLSGTNIIKMTAQSTGVGAGSSDISGKLGKIFWYAAP